MTTVNLILSGVSTLMTGFINIIVSAFTGVTSLWITPASGSDPAELTLLGGLSLLAFVSGVIWLAIRFIGSMISLRQAR